jgi:hypothetical protein
MVRPLGIPPGDNGGTSMKKTLIIATLALAAMAAPAAAGGWGYGNRGGSQGLGVNVGLDTGKNGLIGTLLGGNNGWGHGSNGVGVNVDVNTGKNGVLGTLLGGGRDYSHGHGW